MPSIGSIRKSEEYLIARSFFFFSSLLLFTREPSYLFFKNFINKENNQQGYKQENKRAWTGSRFRTAESVEVLIDNGANVDAKDYNSETALMKEESKGFNEIEDLLKQAGAQG